MCVGAIIDSAAQLGTYTLFGNYNCFVGLGFILGILDIPDILDISVGRLDRLDRLVEFEILKNCD